MSSNIGPYRLIHSFDLTTADYRTLLSKALKIMTTLEDLAKSNNAGIILRQLNIIDSRRIFGTTFDILCRSFHPALTDEEIERRHYGESSYVTFYDLIRKLKKRNHQQLQEN